MAYFREYECGLAECLLHESMTLLHTMTVWHWDENLSHSTKFRPEKSFSSFSPLNGLSPSCWDVENKMIFDFFFPRNFFSMTVLLIITSSNVPWYIGNELVKDTITGQKFTFFHIVRHWDRARLAGQQQTVEEHNVYRIPNGSLVSKILTAAASRKVIVAR